MKTAHITFRRHRQLILSYIGLWSHTAFLNRHRHMDNIPTKMKLRMGATDSQWIFRHLSAQPYQTSCRLQASLLEPISQESNNRLVIFDKDGTLVCIHAMWAPWIRGFAQRIESATNDTSLADKIYNKVSFDNTTGEIKPGLLGEATMPQIRDAVIQLLIDNGVPGEKVTEIMEECWQSRDLSDYGGVEPIGDLTNLFKRLKSKGYQIAVNTSDSRNVTERTIDALKLGHLIDMVVCGDDDDILPKPHPSTAVKICNKLHVHPGDAIMIGDSTTDLMLAVNSGLKYGIGVLTGIAPRDVLEKHTTHIVNDVHQALKVILETDN